MEIPTTIDELENVLVAVRDNDPDGDGAKDTYGLSNTSLNAVFGAYGDIPMKEFRGTGSQKLYYTMRDGKVVFACVQPEMKEALTKLQQWYKDGLIDPEFVTGENTGGYWAISQAFNNDKIAVTGMVTPYHWLTPESDEIAGGPCWTEFVALHPDTELEPPLISALPLSALRGNPAPSAPASGAIPASASPPSVQRTRTS